MDEQVEGEWDATDVKNADIFRASLELSENKLPCYCIKNKLDFSNPRLL